MGGVDSSMGSNPTGETEGMGFVGWKRRICTALMLTFGYIGETTPGTGLPGFILGLRSWGSILFEIFDGKSSKKIGA